MSTVTPREARFLERQDRILDIVVQLLPITGYVGLRMDHIADRIGCSKGTIYQHFANKEEIVFAISNRALDERDRMIDRAMTLRETPREKMEAIGVATELFFEQNPQIVQFEAISRLSCVLKKVSPRSRERRKVMQTRWKERVGELVRSAVIVADLRLPQGTTEKDVVFGLWSVCVGGLMMLSCVDSVFHMGVERPFDALRTSNQKLLDGMGWKPLSSERNSSNELDKLKAELQTIV